MFRQHDVYPTCIAIPTSRGPFRLSGRPIPGYPGRLRYDSQTGAVN